MKGDVQGSWAARAWGTLARVAALIVVVALSACSSPTRPSVSIVSGQPFSPESASTFSYYSQPIVLSVTPGVVTTGEPPTSVVDVAKDRSFVAIVMTKPVPSGNGPFTVTLDRLDAAATYFWRVRTTAGDHPAVVSPSSTFTIGPQLVIQPPTPLQPLADTFPSKRPAFSVSNVRRTGPPATLTYTFEVSVEAGFAELVTSGTVSEAAEQTTFTPEIDLRPGATYFWRARATDRATGVTSPASSAQVFTIVFPDTGTYRYRLVVRSTPQCAGVISTGYVGRPWPQADFGFEGTLVVQGDTLRYEMPPNYFLDLPPLRLESTRKGNRVEGSVSGTFWRNITDPWTWLTWKGVITGTSDNGGRFDGSSDGDLVLGREGHPPSAWSWRCAVRSAPAGEFRWTLLPYST